MSINPAIRQIIIFFAISASLALAASITVFTEISIIYAALLGALCVGNICYHTSPARRYTLPMLWGVFFIFGYILSFAGILIDPESAAVGPRSDPQLFVFSNASFLPVFLVIVAGLTGITAAAATFENIFHRKKNRTTLRNERAGKNQIDRLPLIALLLLLVCSLAVIGVMWILGIGRTGLPHATSLPFMLTGILVYIKNVVLPFLGFVVFVYAERVGEYRRLRQVSWALVIIGALGSVAFISRGFFIFMVLPASIYIVFYGRDREAAKKFLRDIGLLIVVSLLVLIPLIDLYRLSLYSGVTFTSLSNLETVSILGAFAKLLDLMTARIVGFRELVFIINDGSVDYLGPWRYFSNDYAYTEMLTFHLYGFLQDSSGETAFGYALGLWGMLFLGGDYLFVFLGSAVATAVVLAFEELFLRKGYWQVSIFIAFTIGLWIWGGIDWFLLSRLLVSSLLCYFILLNTRLFRALRS